MGDRLDRILHSGRRRKNPSRWGGAPCSLCVFAACLRCSFGLRWDIDVQLLENRGLAPYVGFLRSLGRRPDCTSPQ
eukprot:4994136-Pyramimonas_sp.AAC.1